MEDFLNEVEGYAGRRGISPSSVIQDAIGASGTQWAKWVSGKMTPTMKTVSKVRQYMAEKETDAAA